MARRTATASINFLVFTVLSMALLLGAAALASLVQNDALALQKQILDDAEARPTSAGFHSAPPSRPH
jgi:hypothetical protein